jgi:hypothetical protein
MEQVFVLTDCATLQEAVLAWQRLAPEQQIRATVKVIGGPVYMAHEIDLSVGRKISKPRQPSDFECQVFVGMFSSPALISLRV